MKIHTKYLKYLFGYYIGSIDFGDINPNSDVHIFNIKFDTLYHFPSLENGLRIK